MEAAVKTLFVGFNPEITSQKQRVCFLTRVPSLQKPRVYDHMSYFAQEYRKRVCNGIFSVACVASPAMEVLHDSKSQFKDFTVSAYTRKDRDIKVRVDASGAKTQAIFDDVFSKLVEAAQPIPGFRRMKGGKTPDIPKDVLMHILGPAKVYEHSIEKLINCTIAEYVKKEGLKVSNDLRVEQSYEELEEMFVPGKEFGFDATIQLQETK